MPTTLINQLIALDIVALVLIAPLAVLAGRLVLHGHPAGAVLGTGPAAFAALFGLAVFVAVVQWLPALADMMHDRPTRADYLRNPAMTWMIALLDLGIAVPAAVAAGVGLVRGTAWGRKAAYAVAGFFALVGPAVAAMAITMQINDDPNATAANVVVMSVAGLVLAVLGIALYWPLLHRHPAHLRPAVMPSRVPTTAGLSSHRATDDRP
jgi:hypothetical protein